VPSPYGVDMGAAVSQEELEAAYCWEADDNVPRRPDMTAFRRRIRLHQAQWREEHGHPIGSQPIQPRPGERSRPVGSRLPLDYARETGANFLTPGALAAARERTAVTEPFQSFDHQRLWADLLWSPSLAFNLFGDLASDLARADRAVHTWWPDAPGTVCEVRFAHSPGRFDPSYLNSLRSFDAAFILDVGDGTRAVVAVDTRYHERSKAETPKPRNLVRNLEVADRSGAFLPGATAKVKGRSDIALTWLEHLLLLSMVQHGSGAWSWGRYVTVHPAGNTDQADGCTRYRELLSDESTFAVLTLEQLLGSGALSKGTTTALRERYLPS
jgi:PD-(D/E)XK nuclease superfamily